MNLKEAADKVIFEWFTAGGYPDTSEERRLIAEAIHELQKASSAAPQVVADERAAFEAWGASDAAPWFVIPEDSERHGETYIRSADAGAWAAWKARAALQAAPVQAQEPVAETYAHTMSNGRGRPDDPAPFETVCVRLLRNDLPADLKLYAAPVQPVAVPDGWRELLSEIVACDGLTIKATKFAEKARLLLAAPAAQGDALADAYQRREAYYAHTGNSTIDYDGREWGDFIGGWDAAIATKAAS